MTEYICSNCEYTSDRKENVERHINSKKKKCWSDDRPEVLENVYKVNCEYCNKTFISLNGLTYHQKTICITKQIIDKNNDELKQTIGTTIQTVEILDTKNKIPDIIKPEPIQEIDTDIENLRLQLAEKDKIIAEHVDTINRLNEKIQKSNRKIPKSVRQKLWKRKFINSINGKCEVCTDEISLDNFHAGHIVSIKNGGTDVITNLKCLCVSCNLDMGAMDLDEYKNRYYKE